MRVIVFHPLQELLMQCLALAADKFTHICAIQGDHIRSIQLDLHPQSLSLNSVFLVNRQKPIFHLCLVHHKSFDVLDHTYLAS